MADASPECAAILSIRPTSASSAARAARCISPRSRRAAMSRDASARARRARPSAAAGRLGRDASTTLADRFAECIRTARAGQRRVLRFRPAADRGLLRLQQAGEGPRSAPTTSTPTRGCACRARVAGYKATLWAPTRRPRATRTSTTPTCIFIAGSNTAWAHPVLFRRIEAAKARNPGAEDRRRRSAPHRRPPIVADLHLAIEPGTDVALFHGMLH